MESSDKREGTDSKEEQETNEQERSEKEEEDKTKKDKILDSIYYNIENSASLGSRKRLLEAAKEIIPTITSSDVLSFLEGQRIYSLFKKRSKKVRNKL